MAATTVRTAVFGLLQLSLLSTLPAGADVYSRSVDHSRNAGEDFVRNTWPHIQPLQRRRRQLCESSPTTINGGKSTCRGRLLFEDNFDGPKLDARRWRPDVQLAQEPDFEFVVYTDSAKNVFIQDGTLFLKPALMSASQVEGGVIDLRSKGCTGEKPEECEQKASAFNILPPVSSGRVSSIDKFSFKYGVVEMRAKLPDGHWLYPEAYLEPVEKHYGNHSGRIVLAFARGNTRLQTATGEELGARRLSAGLQLSPTEPARSVAMRHRNSRPPDAPWNDRFRVYRFTWSPERVLVDVDGKRLAEVAPPAGGFQESVPGNNWDSGEKMAPFDREFYLSLGLGVGGVGAFPDNISSGGAPKPWKNTNPKAKLEFWQDRKKWRDTWAWDDAALQVDYIKVWAL